jgi:hypothetical protein
LEARVCGELQVEIDLVVVAGVAGAQVVVTDDLSTEEPVDDVADCCQLVVWQGFVDQSLA